MSDQVTIVVTESAESLDTVTAEYQPDSTIWMGFNQSSLVAETFTCIHMKNVLTGPKQ